MIFAQIFLLNYQLSNNFEQYFDSHMGFFILQIIYMIFILKWLYNIKMNEAHYDTINYIFFNKINLFLIFLSLVVLYFSIRI